MKLLFATPLFLLVGCGAMGGTMGGMNAEQIAAASKDKSSSAGCTQYTGTGGSFVAAYTNTDKGTVGTGGGTVNIKCGSIDFTFTDAGKAPAVVKP